MNPNKPDVEKSIGRRTPVDGAPEEEHTAESTKAWQETCRTEGCDALVSPYVAKEDGTSIEYRRCSEGHLVRQRVLDLDGSTYRTLKTICGP